MVQVEGERFVVCCLTSQQHASVPERERECVCFEENVNVCVYVPMGIKEIFSVCIC